MYYRAAYSAEGMHPEEISRRVLSQQVRTQKDCRAAYLTRKHAPETPSHCVPTQFTFVASAYPRAAPSSLLRTHALTLCFLCVPTHCHCWSLAHLWLGPKYSQILRSDLALERSPFTDSLPTSLLNIKLFKPRTQYQIFKIFNTPKMLKPNDLLSFI